MTAYGKEDMRKRGMPLPDRADALRRRSLAVVLQRRINVGSDASEGITADLMTKAW